MSSAFEAEVSGRMLTTKSKAGVYKSVCPLEYPTEKTDVSYPSKPFTVALDKHSAQSHTKPHRWSVVIIGFHWILYIFFDLDLTNTNFSCQVPVNPFLPTDNLYFICVCLGRHI